MSIRRPSRLVCSILAVSALAVAPAAEAGDPEPTPLFERMNEARADSGLRPLKFAPSLGESSKAYARHLMRSDYFGHASPIRAKGNFSARGEILAYQPGWSTRPGPVIGMWLRSSGHRELMLSSRFTHAGAAIARGRYSGRLATFAVIQFGKR
jgi:uncharacterized protein YkwD